MKVSIKLNTPPTTKGDKAALKLFKAVQADAYNDGFKSAQADTYNGGVITQTGKLKLAEDLFKSGIVFDEKIWDNVNPLRAQRLVETAKTLYGVDMVKMNSTFYKRFSDVKEKSRAELWLDQIAHYMSTYGTNFEGEMYEPEILRGIDFDVQSEMTFIKLVDQKELDELALKMFTTSSALKQDTISDILNLNVSESLFENNVDKISNKELMCIICKKADLVPDSFDEFTRYLWYIARGKTLLVNSKREREMLDYKLEISEQAMADIEFAWRKYLQKHPINEAARNFNRYRKIYLIFRKHGSSIFKHDINFVKKLADKEYVPRPVGALEHILDSKVTYQDVAKAVQKASIFKLIKVYNYLNEQELSKQEDTAKFYLIRNGRGYVTTDNKLKERKNLVERAIKNKLNLRNKVFYIPKFVSYAAPTSQKNFVGNLPFMTKYTYPSGSAIAGIAWNIRADLDLHARTLDGESLGWNGDFDGGGATFSGDMTDLNRYGHAAEFYSLSNLRSPIALSCFKYFSPHSAKIPFDVFVTDYVNAEDEAIKKQGVAKAINERSLLFHDEVDKNGKSLMAIFPEDGELNVLITGFNFDNGIIPSGTEYYQEMLKALRVKADHVLTLEELIKLCGGRVIDDKAVFETGKKLSDTDDYEFIDLSPSKVAQADILSLLDA